MEAPDELSTEQCEALRRALEALREQLETSLATGADAASPVELDQAKVGRVSRVDALQQQAMARNAQRSQRQRLTLIKAALNDIEQGEYGYCRSCEEPIGYERLAARPESRFCITCQAAHERR